MFLEIVSSSEKPPLIQATIDQFNKVVHAVEATCLCSRLTNRQRKIVLCKWIQVASVCLKLNCLKNSNTLKLSKFGH